VTVAVWQADTDDAHRGPSHLWSDGTDELGAVGLFDFDPPFDIGGQWTRGGGVDVIVVVRRGVFALANG
jgi:hypothetical protein